MHNALYLSAIINHIPRLLGLIDRDPLSPTYGCGDRHYWHYKLIDTPSARLQESCLTLSLLFNMKSTHNPYYQQEKIKQWAIAMMQYWSKTQKGNGSFDEWYPNEDSVVATGFTLFAVTESLLILKYSDNQIYHSVIRAANWLIKKKEFEACNQYAGVCLALWNVYELTHETTYKDACIKKLRELLKMQTSEGWFPEYHGADMGYSTVLYDYLAKLYVKSEMEMLNTPLKSLSKFLETCQHPDGTIGGEYGSRNTQYIIPDGFLRMQEIDPTAKTFIHRYEHWLSQHVLAFDDRYLAQNGYTYLQASTCKTGNIKLSRKSKHLGITHYPQSGLLIISQPKYFCIINAKKGGVLKVFDQKSRKMIFQHSGVIVETMKGKQFSDQHLSSGTLTTLGTNHYEINSTCSQITRIQPTPLKQVLFRAVQLLGSVIPGFSQRFKAILRYILITKKSESSIHTIKTIHFSPNSLKIHMQILANNAQFKRVEIFDTYSFLYVPSSRYFSQDELDTKQKNYKILKRKKKDSYSWDITISFI